MSKSEARPRLAIHHGDACVGYTIAAEAARIEEALEATKNADFETTHPHFETFSHWCIASGYTKTPLTQQADDGSKG